MIKGIGKMYRWYTTITQTLYSRSENTDVISLAYRHYAEWIKIQVLSHRNFGAIQMSE